MPIKETAAAVAPSLDVLQVAKRCREIVLQRFTKTSCIETSELFRQVISHLGAPATNVVCQVIAYSPELAKRMKAGTVDPSSIDQPGFWSVGVGLPEFPEDYVGRYDAINNRFVGHVVCVVEGHLVDPSVDQMSRPERDMPLREPVICRLTKPLAAQRVAFAETAHGVLLKYVMHANVAVPLPKRGKILERMAQGLMKEFSWRAPK